MATPPGMQKLQTAIESTMNDLQATQLVPLQKDAFLCSAKCCDKHARDMGQLQACTTSCQAKIARAHEVLYGTLEEFQGRFSRCLTRCQDSARESLPSEPKQKDLEQAQQKQLACMEGCAGEYERQVPKLRADCAAAMKRL